MAIASTPPVTLTSGQIADIGVLSNLLILISNILDGESAILEANRTMTPTAIASLNTTLTDASDRIDVTINPAAAV